MKWREKRWNSKTVLFIASVLLTTLTYITVPSLPFFSDVFFDASAYISPATCTSSKRFVASVNKYSEHVQAATENCGELCDQSTAKMVPGPFFNYKQTGSVNCTALWSNEALDKPSPDWPPLSLEQIVDNVGSDMLCDFTLNGATRVVEAFYHGAEPAGVSGSHVNYAKRPAGKAINWKKEDVDNLVAEAGARKLGGTYGKVDGVESPETADLIDALKHIPKLRGSHVLVIGSETPWVEAICLSLGASHVTSLEYGAITSDHPQLSSLTPDEARKSYAAGKLSFDHVVSFSSLEHSGLGRYGDSLNPWGDVQTVARAWCITKPGGSFAVAVPQGPDVLFFNAHRSYGKLRYPLLSANWLQKYRTPGWWVHGGADWQRVHIFERDSTPRIV